jgi:hypothetical protein
MKPTYERQSARLALGILLLATLGTQTYADSSAATNGVPAAPAAPPATNAPPVEVPSQSEKFLLVSATDVGQGSWDVKLKSFRTGYVHSLTLILGDTLPFKVGRTVKQINFVDGRVCIQVDGKRYWVASGAR